MLNSSEGRSFEDRWRRRFEQYGTANQDDAGIAGWSKGGLDARLRHFERLWALERGHGVWLDAGCGAGTYSRFLAAHGIDVVAIDYSWPSTRKAKERSSAAIRWATADVAALPIRDGTFDGVLCFGVLQALASPRRAIDELARVLRPGAMAWVDALNADCLPTAASQRLRRWRHRPQHLRYDRAGDLVRLMQVCGFENVRYHFVPIMPGRVGFLQPAIESRAGQRVLGALPSLARLVSHALVLVGQKRA